MNLFSQIRTHINTVVSDMIAAGQLPEDAGSVPITVEPPRDALHGDMSTNAAMVLAGKAKSNPRALAETLVEQFQSIPHLTEVTIAGPGFINFRFEPAFWQQIVPAILSLGEHYGDSDMGAGQRVNVEYVSANPTGPLHIGHARGAVYGDALALLLMKTGHGVVKEYYVNDAGSQVDTLARSAFLRYRQACGESIGKIPAGLYPGDYLIPAGQALKEKYGISLSGSLSRGTAEAISRRGDEMASSDMEYPPRNSETFALVKRFTIDAMLDIIRGDLQKLGIAHDVFTSEQSLHDAGAIPKAIEALTAKGVMYRGVLEAPKGKKPDDWEEREQLLFRSTDFGDDCDRAIQKPDGSYTYFAADLAYAQDKIDRGFDSLVYMLGADHGGYKKRMEAAIGALSDKKVHADIKLCQLVHLFQNGEPFKMSKRAGNFITVDEVVEAVGKDILRFIMLTRKNDMVMEFDLEKVKEQSKENPVFYVQYAHARAHSVQRIAAEQMPEAHALIDKADVSLLSSDAQLAVMRVMAEFPRMIEAAASAHEPHRIAFYLQELAAAFHGLWNVGNGDEASRFLVPANPQLTAARLALARSVACVVACGLQVLGTTPLDEL